MFYLMWFLVGVCVTALSPINDFGGMGLVASAVFCGVLIGGALLVTLLGV